MGGPDKYIGPKTREHGISEADLLQCVEHVEGEATCLKPIVGPCTNGLLWELYTFYVRKRYSCTQIFTTWVKMLTKSTSSDAAIWGYIKTLHSKRDKLRRKKKKDEINNLESEPWMEPVRPTSNRIDVSDQVPDETHVEVVEQTDRNERPTVNSSRVKSPVIQKNLIQYKIMMKNRRLMQINKRLTTARSKLHKLNVKIGQYNPKNVKRREQRLRQQMKEKENEICTLKSGLQHLTDENSELKETIKQLESKCTFSVKSCKKEERKKNYVKRKLQFACKDDDSEKQKEIKRLKLDLTYAEANQTESTNEKRCTVKHGVFTNDTRECVVDLVGLEVAADKVAPVIKSVSKHIFHEQLRDKQLPQRQCVQNIVDESQYLMKVYYNHKLSETSHWGLNKDGTSRHRKKIMDTAIPLDGGDVLPLGFCHVAHETAKTIAETVQSDLNEVVECGAGTASKLNLGEMLEKFTFTMSDRAANEKAANRLLGEWRDEILSQCGSTEEKSQLHHFHCMAHALLGFHTYGVAEFTKLQSKLENERTKFGRDNNGRFFMFVKQNVAERTTRLTSDIVGPMGDQKNGVQDKWSAYCSAKGIKSNIPTYKDNRFNALFETAAAIVHHHKELVDFLQYVAKSGNKNGKVVSVREDLEDVKVMAVMKALAVTFIKVTGPYWDLVTSSNVEYLELYKFIKPIHEKVCLWIQSPDLILTDNITNLPSNASHPFHASVVSGRIDIANSVFQQTVVAILSGIKLCCEKQLCDFLADGKYSSAATDADIKATAKSHVTNLSCERHFGTLDASQQRRRHATLHYHSSIIMLKCNSSQMLKWIHNHEDRDQLWLKARRMGQTLRKKHKTAEKQQEALIAQELQSVNSSYF